MGMAACGCVAGGAGLCGVSEPAAVCGAACAVRPVPCAEAVPQGGRAGVREAPAVSGRGGAEYSSVCSFRVSAAHTVEAGGPLVEGRALRVCALAFDRADPAGDASGHVRSGRPDEQQPGRVPRLALLLPGAEAGTGRLTRLRTCRGTVLPCVKD